ncbi:MAG TPA: metallophosphoesterase, partial [Actinomycetota bacterium]|nr:metallophosphoesterase [Actinomycetota bacterium]
VRLGLYEADVVLMAGDLTGKAMVPIVRTDDGWEAELAGRRRHARDEDDLEAIEQDVANLGFYPMRMEQADVERVAGDPEALHALFIAEIRSRLRRWLDLADERLEGTGVPVVVIPGNDDPYEIDDVLADASYCENVDGRVAEIPGGLEVIGLGVSSPTPWNTPREVPEDDFFETITRLTDQAKDPRRTVLLIHCPPYDTGLDTAPLLDDDLRLRASAGDLMRGPVGSRGVRRAIEGFRPLLGLHGHIHESGGEAKIGDTLVLNPGSEAAYGVLRGYLVDVGSSGVDRAFRVEG